MGSRIQQCSPLQRPWQCCLFWLSPRLWIPLLKFWRGPILWKQPTVGMIHEVTATIFKTSPYRFESRFCKRDVNEPIQIPQHFHIRIEGNLVSIASVMACFNNYWLPIMYSVVDLDKIQEQSAATHKYSSTIKQPRRSWCPHNLCLTSKIHQMRRNGIDDSTASSKTTWPLRIFSAVIFSRLKWYQTTCHRHRYSRETRYISVVVEEAMRIRSFENWSYALPLVWRHNE